MEGCSQVSADDVFKNGTLSTRLTADDNDLGQIDGVVDANGREDILEFVDEPGKSAVSAQQLVSQVLACYQLDECGIRDASLGAQWQRGLVGRHGARFLPPLTIPLLFDVVCRGRGDSWSMETATLAQPLILESGAVARARSGSKFGPGLSQCFRLRSLYAPCVETDPALF